LAISSDYAGASGSNHGWVSYEEVWAVVSENGRRLFEELCAVPTRKNSIKFIATYSGFSNESELLWDLHKQAVGRDEHPDGQGSRIHPTLPVYANRQARIFCYWDHEPRMPWQTAEYYEGQRRTLRHSTYLRLHENRWTTGEEAFISAEKWDGLVEPGLRPDPSGALFVGVDASLRRDSTAIVSVKYSPNDDRLVLADHKTINPGPGGINLESAIEFYIRRLYNSFGTTVAKIFCDPFQMARSMQTLQAAGIDIEEFPQTLPNLTLSTETLLSAVMNRNLRVYPFDDLRSHVLNAVTVESPRGIRLSKQNQSAKIDGCVALSFACLAAVQYGRPPSETDRPASKIVVNTRFDARGNYLRAK
jgi:hypothetical protein